jgi:RimJ/RimL family protein N-acetyltransferase
MFEVLEGQNIRLRKAKEDDYQSMLKHVWGDEAVYRWMLYQPTLTEEDALDRCRRSMDYQKEHYAYFVALKETNEAIGLCAIKESDPGHFEESGICIGTAFQGLGYGKEIVALLLELAFTHLGAEDFRYGYFHDNEKSRKVAEHFGFRYEKTYELTRPWDGSIKTIDSCILTRKEYRGKYIVRGG